MARTIKSHVRTIKARGLSFKIPKARTTARSKPTALLAQPKGLRKNIGPRTWKHIPMGVPNPPKTGNGKGGKQIMMLGIGTQTQRAQGPTMF